MLPMCRPHSRFVAAEGVPELHPGYRRSGGYADAPGVTPTGLRAKVGAIALQPRMPGWWFAFALSATLASALALAGGSHVLRRATTLTPARFRRAAAGWDRMSVLAVWFAAVAAMALGSALAERSWIEGAFRGGFEVLAFGVGFLAFGRRLGLRAARADSSQN